MNDSPIDSTLAPTEEVLFTPDNANFLNPERGFYWPITAAGEMSNVRVTHHCSLVFVYSRLDAYRESPQIPDSRFLL